MPRFAVSTPQRNYDAIIERGLIARAGEFVPAKAGIVFVLTTPDVWKLHGPVLEEAYEALGRMAADFLADQPIRLQTLGLSAPRDR